MDEPTRTASPAGLRQLGPYRLEGRLGRGGMGEVYRATDIRLSRAVAVKLMLRYGASDPLTRKRFEFEAQAASALNHPHICTVYDVGEADGCPYLVMELLEGETLAGRLSRGALPWADAIRIARQTADALEAAHAHQIVHRDIKPANIFLTTRGQVKVMDFGIAAKVDTGAPAGAATMTHAEPSRLTELGAAVGTIAYMSPEQARGEPVDARTDLFSLGVVLYEMLAGQRPFSGPTDAVVFDAILNQRLAPLRSIRPEIPPGLDPIVAGLLEKDRTRRTPSARALATALDALPREADHRERNGGPANRTSRRAGVVAAVLLCLTVAGGAGVYWSRGTAPGRPITSLAFLPAETGPDVDREVVAGMVDAVASDLSRTSALQVLPTASTTGSRTTAERVPDLARDLNVDGIVTVSAARAGDHVRLTATLLRALEGRAIWSRTYERPLTNVAALEADVTRDLLAATGAERRSIADSSPRPTAPAVNAEAQDLYLRARYHAARWNPAAIDHAIGLLEQAVAIQPSFGPGQALLGFVYGVKSANYQPNDPVWREKGHAAVEKALAIDPSSPEAHTARGLLLWNHAEGFPAREALAEYRKALEVQPNFDEAWNQRGIILFHVGHLDAGLRAVRRAASLNPINQNARLREAVVRVYQQRYEEAVAILRAVPRDAYLSQWTYQMAWSLVALGRLDEANDVIESALAGNAPDQGGVVHVARAMLRLKRGDRKGALADVEDALRRGRDFIHFHHTAYSIGAIHAQLGNLGPARRWIEEAANSGFPCYTLFETDPYLAPLRATAEFRTYLAALRADWEHIPGED